MTLNSIIVLTTSWCQEGSTPEPYGRVSLDLEIGKPDSDGLPDYENLETNVGKPPIQFDKIVQHTPYGVVELDKKRFRGVYTAVERMYPGFSDIILARVSFSHWPAVEENKRKYVVLGKR